MKIEAGLFAERKATGEKSVKKDTKSKVEWWKTNFDPDLLVVQANKHLALWEYLVVMMLVMRRLVVKQMLSKNHYHCDY